MTFIVTLLVRWGLKDALARRLAPFAAIAAALMLLAALYGAFRVWDWFDDRAAVQADRDKANAAMLERQMKANDRAAGERSDNAITNAEQERAYVDAIHSPKPGDSADPAVRLACEQLRRDGQDTTGLPECGGR